LNSIQLAHRHDVALSGKSYGYCSECKTKKDGSALVYA
jgi:hypothetical protein